MGQRARHLAQLVETRQAGQLGLRDLELGSMLLALRQVPDEAGEIAPVA